MFRVICAKWGDYDDNTISQLYDNVKEKSSVPFDFLCFTEFGNEFDKYQHQKGLLFVCDHFPRTVCKCWDVHNTLFGNVNAHI